MQWYITLKVNIKRLVVNMNFFKKESILSQVLNPEVISIKTSRTYAALLSISVLIIVLNKGLDQTTVSETVSFPSLATFNRLQALHPNTLSCSCQQIKVPYSSFVSVTAVKHQVSYSTT